MESDLKNATIYEFDGFRLVPGEALLLRKGEPVALNIKSFDVLKLLVERHGHLVTKSEIIDIVWEDAFVEEGSLPKAIHTIRHALGDTSKERFIQTVPRKGYRFVAPVSVLEASGSFRLADLAQVADMRATNGKVIEPITRAANGHAVEPVADETAHFQPEDNGHFKQAPNTSVFRRFRRSAVYAGIGVVLLAGLVLYAVLNGRYPGKDNHPQDRGTKNDEAYRLYLLANNLMEQRGTKNVQRALENVDKAVVLDPNFARAWAAKAMFHLLNTTGTPSEQYQLSKEAVDKALAIDPNLSEAYSVLCYFRIGYEFDFAGGETVCKHAVDLDPNSPSARRTYAQFLSTRGRFDESVAESRKAIDLEPQSYLNQMDYGLVLYYARRFEEEAQWKRLIDLNPNDSFNYRRLSKCMLRQGREAEAFEYLIKALTMEKADNDTIERFQTAYRESGWRGVTLEQISRAEANGLSNPFGVACLYARLGDKDKAFEFLEKTYKERDDLINELEVEPQLDPLRNDPRYADLVRRVEGK